MLCREIATRFALAMTWESQNKNASIRVLANPGKLREG